LEGAKPIRNFTTGMKALNIAQIAVSVLLMVSILLQNRGSGLSATFGGDFGGYYTKRGMEKFLFYFSIVMSVGFLALSIASFILSNK
jgi:protein translocase SecG subunit